MKNRTDNADTRRGLVLVGLVSAVMLALTLVDSIVRSWNNIYDDAYISFRYSRNLAEGAGLVWNPGASPTEGFTNPLLVLILAPAIRIGADPLLTSRLLSAAAAGLICVILYLQARRTSGASEAGALAACVLFPLFPATIALALVGMETIPYALGLLCAFLLGARFLVTNARRHGILFAVLVIVTSLLRPEALLLVPLVGAYWIFRRVRRGGSWAPGAWTLATLAIFFVPYLVWKWQYFGDVLPNPFYIKSSSGLALDASGVASVTGFVTSYGVLIALFMFAVYSRATSSHVPRSEGDSMDAVQTTQVTLAALIGLTYVLFFLRTSTLMDIEGRFLFPLVPIALAIASPVIDKVIRWTLDRGTRHLGWAAIPVAVALVVTANITPQSLGRMLDLRSLPSAPERMTAQLDANVQLRLARALASLPSIRTVKIAYGDAGVIPYYSGAQWLDPVGLNDSFIARTRDKAALIDYFFDAKPDVVFLPSDHGGSWITYGHGPLGDYQSWSSDPRWDGYNYIGTVRRTDTPYDLQVLVRSSAPDAAVLAGHLKKNVVNGRYEELPLPLGTRAVTSSPNWTPSAQGD